MSLDLNLVCLCPHLLLGRGKRGEWGDPTETTAPPHGSALGCLAG